MTTMKNTGFASLTPEWRDWVKNNLARGCDPAGMAAVMVRDGGFSHAWAVAVIEEKMGKAIPATQRSANVMPYIDMSFNKIRAVDRDVDLLMSLKNPQIALLGGVLSDEECDELAHYCEKRMQRSSIVNDKDGTTAVDPRRTSSGAMIQRGETELVAKLEARLAALANWPVENAEGMQVLCYGPGNEYRSHFDWFDPEKPGARKHMENGGQRVGTFVIYLSEVEQGGGTAFPSIGLEIHPKRGGAVFFANTDPFGTPDKLTLHAGSPVIKGVKFVANKWLRQSRY